MRALLVDVGNTRLKWRVERIDTKLDPKAVAPLALPCDVVPLDMISTLTARWFADEVLPFETAFVSNVAAPELDDVIARALSATRPRATLVRVTATARARVDRGWGPVDELVNAYADPTKLGSDRWLAAIGAYANVNVPVVVCNFGTATTIDLVLPTRLRDDQATFVGGQILPGVDAMRSALARGTARLPDVPGHVVDFADNTADAIESGVIGAQRGAVERACRAAQLRADDVLSPDERPAILECVFSGGVAARVADGWTDPPVHILRMEELVLRGLAQVARTTLTG